jgi:YidC/Oxa1 family membrane protein insertase
VLVDSLSSLVLADIPVWEQYRTFLEWSLNGIADFTGSAGLAIIVFTIIIKTILLPLTIKATRSSKAMQEIAPRIKQIQKKHGKDRQKASQETMALYQQHGVNPMAGCLPMLIQIPIFFGLYRAIFNLSGGNVGEWGQGFLWLPDLSEPDPIFLLPVLAGLFQFIQTRMMRPANQPKSDDPQQQIMNVMMNFMPLMVVVFGIGFASGPVIYWAAQSAYSVVQQWFITGWGSLGEWFPWLPELPEHRRLGYKAPRNLDDVVVVSGGAGATAQQTGVQGWMMRKMEQAQKTAAERQAQIDAQKKERSGGSAGNTTDSDASDDGDATDTPSPFTAKKRDSSSSYQARVDAATKFKAKSRNGTGNGTTPSNGSAWQAMSSKTSTKAAPKVSPRKKSKRR